MALLIKYIAAATALRIKRMVLGRRLADRNPNTISCLMPISETYNIDCMDYMRQFPNKHFELAIVDPPYGIGESGGEKKRFRKKNNNKRIVIHQKKDWDNQRPNADYWRELFRISKNQIVWGGNYFTDFLPPKMGWVFWNKLRQ